MVESNIDILLTLDITMVLIMQLAATVQDIRTREISDWTWIAGGLVAVPLGFYVSYISHGLLTYLISVVMGSILAFAIYFMRAMGGADAKSLAVLSASVPTYPLGNMALTVINLTPLSILINSLIIALIIYIPYNALASIKYINKCNALGGMGFTKYIYIVILMCTPAYKVLRNPNNYSISQDIQGGVSRPIVSLGLSTEDPVDTVVNWLSKGYIDVDTPILVTYHIPFILAITLGLIMYIIMHANLLVMVLSLI